MTVIAGNPFLTSSVVIVLELASNRWWIRGFRAGMWKPLTVCIISKKRLYSAPSR